MQPRGLASITGHAKQKPDGVDAHRSGKDSAYRDRPAWGTDDGMVPPELHFGKSRLRPRRGRCR